MRSIPRAQEVYKHFKGNVYQIITIAEHSENGEKMVIYQAMYGDFKVYARPLTMFMEKVDKQKYPEVKQEYRFEKVEREEVVYEESSETLQVVKEVCESAVQEQKSEEPCLATEACEPVAKEPQKMQEPDVTEAELQLDPLLLDFLDADTYEKKLNILAALHSRITDDMITTMAIASDVEVADGELEVRYNQLKNCLLTLDRYEISRLR